VITWEPFKKRLVLSFKFYFTENAIALHIIKVVFKYRVVSLSGHDCVQRGKLHKHFLPKVIFGKKSRKLFWRPRLVPCSHRVRPGSKSSAPSPSGNKQVNKKYSLNGNLPSNFPRYQELLERYFHH